MKTSRYSRSKYRRKTMAGPSFERYASPEKRADLERLAAPVN
jgi:hypothetical protein